MTVLKKVKVNFNLFSQNYFPKNSKATLAFLPCLTTSFQKTALKTQIIKLKKIIDIFLQHMELYHLKGSFKLTVSCALTARKLLKQHDMCTIARCAPEF